MKYYYAYLPEAEGARFLVKASSEDEVHQQVQKHYEDGEFEEDTISEYMSDMEITEINQSFFTEEKPDSFMLE